MKCTSQFPCNDPGSVECACEPETPLQEAQRLVHGDRNDSYGHPIDDYTCTGRLWAGAIDRWIHKQPGFENAPTFPDIPPELATLMMGLMKVSRQIHKPKRDNLVDLAGYAECTHMIVEEQAKRRAF